MAIRCIAVDDEPLALEIINSHVSRFPELEMVQIFEDAVTASEFLRHTTVDILFADINMPGISGINLVPLGQEKPVVIFTTAYKNFAYESFELEALDYLLKPIDFERFSKAVRKALDYLEHKNQPAEKPAQHFYVHSEYRLVKIDFREIDYIESFEDCIKINMYPASPVLTLLSMKNVLEKLPADKFRRIHHSFIVPVANVVSIDNRKVKLSSGKELPVSYSYLGFIQDWLNQKI